MKKYLTTKEIAKLLKVNEVTVRRWIQRGKLPAIRFGREYRIKEQDLEKYGNFRKRKKSKGSLKFSHFLLGKIWKILPVRADFFGSAAGGLPAEALAKAGGRRAGVARPPRAAELTL